MAVVALVLLGIFALLGFGWRSWIQRRRTGSTGFRGVSGKVGSAEWIGGVAFVGALATIAAAPLLQLLGVVAPLGPLHVAWIQITGVVVASVGIAATVYAQLAMGDAWRIGVDATETTTLVRASVFAWVRNPIYTAMFTVAVGIALVTPNVLALIGFVLLVASIQMQVRVVEEPYLLGVHGDSFRGYTATVGRFVPGIGLIR